MSQKHHSCQVEPVETFLEGRMNKFRQAQCDMILGFIAFETASFLLLIFSYDRL